MRARKQYASLLREIIDPNNRPLVFHCSQGVHRAGIGAALVLSALDVPWETVRGDYLLSNVYRKTAVEKRLAAYRASLAKRRGVAPEQVNLKNLEAYYILQGAYIDAARDAILEEFGSMDRYFRDGLGLSAEELKRFRSELLE